MLRGLAFEGVSPLPKFVTMYCPMPELKTRILVVDDDQRLRDLLVRYLGGEGYEVKAVPTPPAWTSSSPASATTWWCST